MKYLKYLRLKTYLTNSFMQFFESFFSEKIFFPPQSFYRFFILTRTPTMLKLSKFQKFSAYSRDGFCATENVSLGKKLFHSHIGSFHRVLKRFYTQRTLNECRKEKTKKYLFPLSVSLQITFKISSSNWEKTALECISIFLISF